VNPEKEKEKAAEDLLALSLLELASWLCVTQV